MNKHIHKLVQTNNTNKASKVNININFLMQKLKKINKIINKWKNRYQ